jgi:hypothetical protein
VSGCFGPAGQNGGEAAEARTVVAAQSASDWRCRGGTQGGERWWRSDRPDAATARGATRRWRADERARRGEREADRWDPTADNSRIKNNSE